MKERKEENMKKKRKNKGMDSSMEAMMILYGKYGN